MFTLALVIFKIHILNIKYDRTNRPKSLSLQSHWKMCIPVSTNTRYLKNEPNSQTLNFLLCLNLETSHLAKAAQLLWRPNERYIGEYTDEVHIVPACELNPVMVAVSSPSGMRSGSQCVCWQWESDGPRWNACRFQRITPASNSLRVPHQPPVLGVSGLSRLL